MTPKPPAKNAVHQRHFTRIRGIKVLRCVVCVVFLRLQRLCFNFSLIFLFFPLKKGINDDAPKSNQKGQSPASEVRGEITPTFLYTSSLNFLMLIIFYSFLG